MEPEIQFVIALDQLLVIPSDSVLNLSSFKNFVDPDLVEKMPTALLFKIASNAIVVLDMLAILTTDVTKNRNLFVNQTHAVPMHNVLSALMVKAFAFVLKV